MYWDAHFLHLSAKSLPLKLKVFTVSSFLQVSDCLLNWLKSLPSPVIPCKLFHAFLHVHHTCSHSQWVYQLQVLFEKVKPHSDPSLS